MGTSQIRAVRTLANPIGGSTEATGRCSVREYAAMVQLPESAILYSESNVNMDTTAILTEIGKLPVEDQIVLVQRVWDAIADSDTPLDLTDTQKAEISRRSAELDANPDLAIPWDDVKRSLNERCRR